MPSEKAMELSKECAWDIQVSIVKQYGTFQQDKAQPIILGYMLGHTAEALADYKRVLGDCERVLRLALATLTPTASPMDVNQVKANAADALAAIAELKGKE